MAYKDPTTIFAEVGSRSEKGVKRGHGIENEADLQKAHKRMRTQNEDTLKNQGAVAGASALRGGNAFVLRDNEVCVYIQSASMLRNFNVREDPSNLSCFIMKLDFEDPLALTFVILS